VHAASLPQVRTLIPKVERLIHNNGTESELLVLSGTIAIAYGGKQYNIPVDIYISEPYPDAPPRCYVRPTKDMEIKAGHRHVDREVGPRSGAATARLMPMGDADAWAGRQGLVYLPYLHEWQARDHKLTELCGHMSSVFSADPPCYAVRKSQVRRP
jgi:ESCRT-I complex subunit TSG101